jgi:hypothetical protein
MDPGSKEFVFRGRVLEILEALALQWPSLSIRVDFWRLSVVSQSDDYSDKQVERWVRLAENVPAFLVSSAERWFEKEVGIIRMNMDWLITTALYNLEPNDHVIVNGEPWMITEAVEQAGIGKLKIDRVKSRFKAPPRTDPVYRQLIIKARIV